MTGMTNSDWYQEGFEAGMAHVVDGLASGLTVEAALTFARDMQANSVRALEADGTAGKPFLTAGRKRVLREETRAKHAVHGWGRVAHYLGHKLQAP